MDILNPLELPEWDGLLLASNDHSFFHTSYWARVLCDSYNYRPCYLARIHDRKLQALLPVMEVNSLLTGRRGVSLPFTDYCDPIIADHSNLQDMLDFLKTYGEREKWKYLELRGGEDLLGEAPFSSFYYRHVLKLSPAVDALYSQLKSSTKRNIKKASREGVSVIQSNSLDAVRTFYRLHCLTRKKHGLPPQPFYFFQRLCDHIISRGHGKVVLAAYQGKTIAGAVFLQFGNEAIYKFGASDTKYLNLRPNDLVMWEAIHWYARQGYAKFSFGRTDADNEGLREFKSGWGAKEEIIRYFTYDIHKQKFLTQRKSSTVFSQAVFKRIPVGLSRLVGKALYRHVG